MAETTAPPEVLTSAQEHGLGSLLTARKGLNPILTGLALLVLAGLIFGFMWWAGSKASNANVEIHPHFLRKALGFVVMGACLVMVGAIVSAIVTLIRGFRAYYVFAEGFAYKHNRTVRAYRWPEVTELRSRIATTGDNAGKVLGYELVPAGGKKIDVPLELTDGRDEFMDTLIATMKEKGRPVV